MTTTKAAAKKSTTKKRPIADEPVDIEVTVEAPKPIRIALGGERYTVRPIKAAMGIEMGQRMAKAEGDPTKVQENLKHIVQMMFGTTDTPKIMKRLSDPEDDLDLAHVMDLMSKIVEHTNPSI